MKPFQSVASLRKHMILKHGHITFKHTVMLKELKEKIGTEIMKNVTFESEEVGLKYILKYLHPAVDFTVDAHHPAVNPDIDFSTHPTCPDGCPDLPPDARDIALYELVRNKKYVEVIQQFIIPESIRLAESKKRIIMQRDALIEEEATSPSPKKAKIEQSPKVDEAQRTREANKKKALDKSRRNAFYESQGVNIIPKSAKKNIKKNAKKNIKKNSKK